MPPPQTSSGPHAATWRQIGSPKSGTSPCALTACTAQTPARTREASEIGPDRLTG